MKKQVKIWIKDELIFEGVLKIDPSKFRRVSDYRNKTIYVSENGDITMAYE